MRVLWAVEGGVPVHIWGGYGGVAERSAVWSHGVWVHARVVAKVHARMVAKLAEVHIGRSSGMVAVAIRRGRGRLRIHARVAAKLAKPTAGGRVAWRWPIPGRRRSGRRRHPGRRPRRRRKDELSPLAPLSCRQRVRPRNERTGVRAGSAQVWRRFPAMMCEVGWHVGRRMLLGCAGRHIPGVTRKRTVRKRIGRRRCEMICLRRRLHRG